MEYLRKVCDLNPSKLEPIIQNIEELYLSKRWFELGERIVELLSLFSGFRLELFETYIKLFFDALDSLHKANIILYVSEDILPIEKSRRFLESQLSSFSKPNDPKDLLNLQIIFLHTQAGEFEIAHNLLTDVEKRISESTPLIIRSRFHRTQADLDKARGDFDAFYEHALLYLSTSRILESHVLAFDLSMSALCSAKVCSFGELASHPILNSLKDTTDSWLFDLILLLDSGSSDSIPIFNEKFASIILNDDRFKSFLPIIQQKIALSVFLNIIFSRPFDSRIFSFEEISKSCHVPLDQVEWLVMKSLSTELIKGEIDEVEQKVIVTWCKPKALDQNRLKHLKQQIDRWCSIVHSQRVALSKRAQPVVG